MICVGRWFLDCRPFLLLLNLHGGALNDDGSFPFDDGKIFKKVAKGACNFGNMVYSMSSYR